MKRHPRSTPRRSSSRPTTSATRIRASSTRRARTSSTARSQGLRLVRQRVGLRVALRGPAAVRRRAAVSAAMSDAMTVRMNKKTIRDLTRRQLRGKRALVRVDFNVPLDEGDTSPTTRASAPRFPRSRRCSIAARASSCCRTSAARRESPNRSTRSSRSRARLAELLPEQQGRRSSRARTPTKR